MALYTFGSPGLSLGKRIIRSQAFLDIGLGLLLFLWGIEYKYVRGAQWSQIHKKVPFQISLRYFKNCQNMNFRAFKTTKNEIFAPKNVQI